MTVLNTTSLSIDRLRRDGDAFMQDISREYYLAHSGQKPTAELQPVYEKHAAILAPKFRKVEDTFKSMLSGAGVAHWSEPAGGYFDAAVDPAQRQQLILQKYPGWEEREQLPV